METIIVIGFVVLALAIAIAGIVGGLRSRADRKARELESVGLLDVPIATTEAPARETVEAAPSVAEVEEIVAAAPVRPRLRDRLAKTRASFSAFARRGAIDDDTWDELEETLLLADVGLPTTQDILAATRAHVAAEKISTPDGVRDALRAALLATLGGADRSLQCKPGERNVWMFVGVNGVGKTTTIGKLAAQEVARGQKVLLAAADTFRAAAADQLTHWAERAGTDLVRGEEGADPGSIVFDAMAAAGPRHIDLIMIDTAGRLHTKSNLMEELKKLRRIVDRTPDSLREVLLVIDAATGQNGLAQAREFAGAVDVTGVVLTKLDGTAKGGIVLAIQREVGLPVKVIGVGEGIEDLLPFDPEEFVDALLGE
ncbi:MAG: signal recognition particle-docking protein FtsY [Acidimicrobiia bacterium]